MRILIIGSSKRVGLTQQFVNTALAMRDLGVDVIIMSPPRYQSRGLLKLLSDHNIELVVYEKIDSLRIGDILASNFSLNRILKDINPNAILAEGINQLSKVILFKKLNSKVKLISVAGSLPSRNLRTYLSILDKVADYTIALCLYTKRVLIRAGFNPNKIIVTPLFSPYLPLFDELKTRRVELEKYHLSDVRKPVIFYTAYHHPWKGFEYYLLAAKMVLKKYDATFVVGGTGSMTSHLKKLADKLGISKNVVFTGFIQSLQDLYAILYQVVDIAVSTSLREQFPSYILEVMAAGKPIVATNVAGVPEQIFDGFNGFLVKPRDYKSTAEKISKLIEDDYLRKNMGLNGRKIIERIYNRRRATTLLLEKWRQQL